MNKPITLCDRCDKEASCLLNYDGISCRKLRTVQPTNADSIRAMTDEELAEWLDKHVECMGHDCPADKHCGVAESCKQAWLDWLKAEVTE